MLNLFRILFTLNTAKKVKENPIAATIEIKETSAKTWWSQRIVKFGKVYIAKNF